MVAILSRPQCVSVLQSNSPTQIRLLAFNTYPSEHSCFEHDLLKLFMKLDLTLPGAAKHGQCALMFNVYFWNSRYTVFFVIALLCIKWCLLICNLWKIDVLNIPNLRTYVFFKMCMNSNSLFQCSVTEHSSADTDQMWYSTASCRNCWVCTVPTRVSSQCASLSGNDEAHFLFRCKFYMKYRKQLYPGYRRDLFTYAESKFGDFNEWDT